MTWIWLLIAAVSQQAEYLVDSMVDLKAERAGIDTEEENGAELAEMIATSATNLEEYAPDTDRALLQVTRRDGRAVPINGLKDPGLLVVETTGTLGFTIGRGQLVTMLGGDLVQLVHPDPAEYVAAYQLPGFAYWKAS